MINSAFSSTKPTLRRPLVPAVAAVAAWLAAGGAMWAGGMAAAWVLWVGVAGLAAWMWRRSARPGEPQPDAQAHNQALADRLDEAARTWTHHLATAQGQLRDAVEQMLGAFGDILVQLDGLIGAGAERADEQARVAMLAQCDEQLRGLLDQFNGFVQSRNEVLGTVRTLGEASGRLHTMAEDVSSLARHTNLLSINAAIEAARAGQAGRGFAVVANEVRRLSTESGETGQRIGSQVTQFNEKMQRALHHATATAARDSEAIQASERTVSQVVEHVNAAVAELQQRSAAQSAQGEVVKAQVEQLLTAFQFQDRVHQILDQLRTSMADANAALQGAVSAGDTPDTHAWQALLAAGYTTAEQRAVTPGQPATAASSGAAQPIETTFF